MADPFTAAELRAIGERAKRASESTDWPDDWPCSACDVADQLAFDLIRVHSMLNRLIEIIVKEANDPVENPGWWINIGGEKWDHPFPTKDAAIDALLEQGGVE